ncbi:family 16 glycosylhydrolase [Polaribacter sp. R77954]|uniref:family 16 glycosylhydrolase n=1 Tax=Polaribacter sp. R77954 TaxID=3093870 RepID=UPI0037C54D50
MKQFYTVIFSFVVTFASFSQQMPIDFENSNHIFSGFSGASFAQVNDPNEATNKVGQFNNNGAVVDQGFYIDLNRDIDITIQKEITLSFYAFDPNEHKILVKLENGTNPDVEVLQTITSGNATNWQNVTFNFSSAKETSTGNTVNATGTYRKLVIFIDLGATTAGTYLFDDISDGSIPTDPNKLDVVYDKLVWSDEFDNNTLDKEKWHHQTIGIVNGGWANGEIQHYTDREENSFVRNDNLHIVAKRETIVQNGVSRNFTSARLNSKFAFTYGRVDVRAKLPEGEGTFPAIWTLGKNISEPGAYWQTQGFGTTPWPDCGEIDIMEHGLHATNTVSSALHTRSSFGNTVNTKTKPLTDVANTYHVFSMNWSPNQITFLIDDEVHYTYKKPANFTDVNSDGINDGWPFDDPQFLLINFAMGGIAGAVSPSFTESSLVIDYVRIYQQSTASTDDIFNDKFTIYPNPSSSFIHIKTNENINNIEIYSPIGEQVFTKKMDFEKIDISSLSSGLYFIKIYNGKKVATQKIIVRK